MAGTHRAKGHDIIMGKGEELSFIFAGWTPAEVHIRTKNTQEIFLMSGSAMHFICEVLVQQDISLLYHNRVLSHIHVHHGVADAHTLSLRFPLLPLQKLGPLQDTAVVWSIPPGTRHGWPKWPDLLSCYVCMALGAQSLVGPQLGAVIMTQSGEDLLQLLPTAWKIIPVLENYLHPQSQSISRAKVGEDIGKSLWQSVLPLPPF